MSVKTYTVQGMTCGHCVSSVKEEVGEVAGVTGVEVDLASGRLDVAGEGVADEAVRLADRARHMGEPDPEGLLILADVYAQAGRSDEVVIMMHRAIRAAEADGNAKFAERLRGRLKRYQDRIRSESSTD